MDFGRLVVPYDFSEYAQAALEAALELARHFDAELHLVYVVNTPAYGYGTEFLSTDPFYAREAGDAAKARLDEVAGTISDPPRRIETHAVEGGPTAMAIDEFAAQIEADLIVMGTHGRTGLAHALIGSVAERTLRRAPCPVLTVRARPECLQPTPPLRDGIPSTVF